MDRGAEAHRAVLVAHGKGGEVHEQLALEEVDADAGFAVVDRRAVERLAVAVVGRVGRADVDRTHGVRVEAHPVDGQPDGGDAGGAVADRLRPADAVERRATARRGGAVPEVVAVRVVHDATAVVARVKDADDGLEAVLEETALQVGVQVPIPEVRSQVRRAGADRGLGSLRILVDGGVVPAFDRGDVARIAEAGQDDVVGQGFPALGGGIVRRAGVAVIEVLIRGVVARGQRAVADAGDHAVLHRAGVEGEVEFGLPGRADRPGRVREVVRPDIEDLRLGGAGRRTQQGEEARVGADAQRDRGVVGVAQGDIVAAVADVDVFGAVAAPPLEVIREAMVEPVGLHVGALLAEGVRALEAKVALIGHREHTGGARPTVDQRAVGRAVGSDAGVGEEEIADVVAGVVPALPRGEQRRLGPEFKGERGIQDEGVHLVEHRVALGRLVRNREREAELLVGVERAGPDHFGAAEAVGAEHGADAGDRSGAGEHAADVDHAAGAALTVERTARALDDVGATDGDRVDRHEPPEAVLVGGGRDAADQEGVVLGIVLGAASAAGRRVELDAADVLEGVTQI